MSIQDRKEREKEHRREEIVRAATKVFFERGLQSATMDEIAEVAEVSKGTLYLYYKSKEDLYLAVMNIGIDLLYDMFSRTIADSPSTIETLRRFGTTYYEFFQQHRNYYRMFHFFQNPAMHKQVSPEMREICRLHNQRLWDVVITVLHRGIQEGLLRKDIAPPEMAVILWSAANAVMMQIDYQRDHWKQTLGVDLEQVLVTTNRLLIETLMTEESRHRLSGSPAPVGAVA